MPSSRRPEDWNRLVKLVLRRDEEATVQFALDVGRIVTRFLSTKGLSPADAENLAVSCTSDIVLSLQGYQDQGKFEAWMFRIVRNCFANEFRRKARMIHLVESDWLTFCRREFRADDTHDPHQNGVLSESVHSALDLALAQISARERRLIEGRCATTPVSFRVLGEELGMSEGNARVTFHRVSRQLKERLEQDSRIQNWLEGG